MVPKRHRFGATYSFERMIYVIFWPNVHLIPMQIDPPAKAFHLSAVGSLTVHLYFSPHYKSNYSYSRRYWYPLLSIYIKDTSIQLDF